MSIGYAIFHRSVPIIRAWHSQRGSPDVCDLLKVDLVFASNPQFTGLHNCFQEYFGKKIILERLRLIQIGWADKILEDGNSR